MTSLDTAGTPPVAVVVRAGRDLDIYTAANFRAKLRDAAGSGPGTVVVDLDGTEFMDNAGLGVIAAAFKRARAEGRRFGVVCTRPPVLRLFQATGLTKIIDIGTSADDFTGPGTEDQDTP